MSNHVEFEKVSYETFSRNIKKYIKEELSDEEINKMYDEIQVPGLRKSNNFKHLMYPFSLLKEYIFNKYDKGDIIYIPTGIKCKIEDGYYLAEYCIPNISPYCVSIHSPKHSDPQYSNLIYPNYDDENDEEIILAIHLHDKIYSMYNGEQIFYACLISKDELDKLEMYSEDEQRNFINMNNDRNL